MYVCICIYIYIYIHMYVHMLDADTAASLRSKRARPLLSPMGAKP